MARGPVVLSILLLVAGMAGCIGEEASPPETGTGSGDQADGSSGGDGSDGTSSGEPEGGGDAGESQPRARAPSWLPGQTWNYTVVNQHTEPFPVNITVASVSSQAYTVGVDETGSGLQATVFHLPPIGTIQREDLAYDRHGEMTSHLDFPLTDGKTYEKTYQGQALTYTATASQAQVLDRQGPVFEIQGVDEDGNTRVQGTYAPGVANFLRLSTFLAGETDPFTTMALEGFKLSQEGEVQVPTFTDLYNVGIGGPLASTPPGAGFQAPEGLTHLVLAGFLGGAEGHYQVTWQPPAGGPIAMTHDNPPGDGSVVFQMATPSPASGQWQVDMRSGGNGFVFAEAIGVTFEAVTP